jgi:hypothetical protein
VRTNEDRSLLDLLRPIAMLLALAAGACLTGCGEEPDPAGDDRAELERLRALGYVGFTDSRVVPGEPVVTLHDPDRSAPGYNLVSNRNLTSAQLFDAQGNVVHSWQDEGAAHWSNAELLANGDLLVTGSEKQEGPGSNFLLRMSWDGRIVWRKPIHAHHDAEVTAAGTIATLTFRFRRIPEVSAEHPVKDDRLTILSQAGDVLEEHSLYDLLCGDPDVFTCRSVPPTSDGDGKVIDLLHANSLEFVPYPHLAAKDPIYAPTNVLVSLRNQDAVAIFDWKRKRLVWVWGPGELSAQHDARFLDDGHILLFDNGIFRRYSRIVEVDPLREQIVWEFTAPVPEQFFSIRKGSSQRLPNGNTLVANSNAGEAFEVTPDGEIVWRFLNPNANRQGKRATIVRIHRYPPELVQPLLERGSRAR